MIEYFIDVEKYIYPLTVVKDRYLGTYSGGKYTAWNLDYFEIPMDVALSDVPCMEFWDNENIQNNYIIGKGDTAEEAIADLYNKLKGNMKNNEEE